MSEITSYRDLLAWQKTMALGLELYRLTQAFPEHERFGLTIQIRRNAVAVPSHIAEGYGRQFTPDYVRFLKMARGKLYETDTQLQYAIELEYISVEKYDGIKARLSECERILAGLIRSLNR